MSEEAGHAVVARLIGQPIKLVKYPTAKSRGLIFSGRFTVNRP
jgi:hypothetical protein